MENNNKKTLYKFVDEEMQRNYWATKMYEILIEQINPLIESLKSVQDEDKKELINIHESLKIHSKDEIVLNIMDISNLLKIEPSKELRDIISDIETNIVCGKLENKKEDIEKYILKEYGGDK